MNEYQFKNVTFTPDDVDKLKYDGNAIHMAPLQVRLLTFFVKNPKREIKKKEILEAVWGSNDFADTVLSEGVRVLNKLLPEGAKVSSIFRVGYAFNHQVTHYNYKYPQAEQRLKHSPTLKKLP